MDIASITKYASFIVMENYSGNFVQKNICIYILCIWYISVMRAHTRLKEQQARSLTADSVNSVGPVLDCKDLDHLSCKKCLTMIWDTSRLEWPGITEQGKYYETLNILECKKCLLPAKKLARFPYLALAIAFSSSFKVIKPYFAIQFQGQLQPRSNPLQYCLYWMRYITVWSTSPFNIITSYKIS